MSVLDSSNPPPHKVTTISRVLARAASAVLVLALAGARGLLPERGQDVIGPRALADALYSLALTALLLVTALAVGRVVLRSMRVETEGAERAALAALLGLGTLAYAFGALAFAGLVSPLSLALTAAGVAAVVGDEMREVVSSAWRRVRSLPGALRRLEPVQLLIATVLVLLLVLTLADALTPPWDYDGLMYHLLGPKLFLQAGSIIPLPRLWQANGPLTAEMLFMFGLGLGSETLAKLTHLAFALVYLALAHAYASRLLGRAAAWTALAALLGVPLLLFYAGLAYADFAWAAFQVAALLCLQIWLDKRLRRWLVTAGIMAGLALGSKYLALAPVAVLGLVVLWGSRGKGARRLFGDGALFGGLAFLVALPWYLRNWIELGNPVFPFYMPTEAWPRARLDLLMSYLASFGEGRHLAELARIPWTIYFDHMKFGTLFPVADYPGVLFPLAVLYPLSKTRRRLHLTGVVALLWCGLWSLGSQQTRFLLPVFPLFSLLAAASIASLAERSPRPWLGRTLSSALVAVSVIPTLIFAALLRYHRPSPPVVVGAMSKREFLETMVSNYRAMEYIRENLPREARVLMLWDGQGYFCDERCIPDAEQSQWVQLSEGSPAPESLSRLLRSRGVTHLLVSEDAAVIIERHDPAGLHREAWTYLEQVFLPTCAEGVYQDEWVGVFEITCGGQAHAAVPES